MIEAADIFLQASWRLAAGVVVLSLAVLLVIWVRNALRRGAASSEPPPDPADIEKDVDQLVELVEQSRRIEDLQNLVQEELASRKKETEDGEGSVH